jgi:tRNA_anti-like
VPCAIVSIGPDPAIPVTADQLTEAYAADTKAADAKYKGKWVFVEGVVLELRPDEASVILAGAGKKDGNSLRVSASYPDNRKKDFAALKKGDKAKIKGECGGEFLGSITLTSAGLVK